MNAKSVDHLEVINENNCKQLSNSNTVAVLLPGVSFSLKYGYAPARSLIENNAIVALATDYNPGSSHINNISLIWGLAALNMGMSFEEIISSYTINSAKALNVSDKIGSIEIGKDADFSVFSSNNFADLLYNLGNNLCIMTIKNGNIVWEIT
jgi:imidazolonepropionase